MMSSIILWYILLLQKLKKIYAYCVYMYVYIYMCLSMCVLYILYELFNAT